MAKKISELSNKEMQGLYEEHAEACLEEYLEELMSG